MAVTPTLDAYAAAVHVLDDTDLFTWVDFTAAGTNQAVPLSLGIWEASLVDCPSGYVFGAIIAAVIPAAKTEKLGVKIAPGEPRLIQGNASWNFYMPVGSGRLLLQKVR